MYNLEVKCENVEVGTTYPIYGTITKFIDERPGRVVVEINYSIVAEVDLPDVAGVEHLKSRAFEPAILVATVLQTVPQVRVKCSTIIFGKKQEYSA